MIEGKDGYSEEHQQAEAIEAPAFLSFQEARNTWERKGMHGILRVEHQFETARGTCSHMLQVQIKHV